MAYGLVCTVRAALRADLYIHRKRYFPAVFPYTDSFSADGFMQGTDVLHTFAHLLAKNSYYDANAAKTKLYVEGICMHIKYETLLPDVNALSFPSRGAGGGTNGPGWPPQRHINI